MMMLMVICCATRAVSRRHDATRSTTCNPHPPGVSDGQANRSSTAFHLRHLTEPKRTQDKHPVLGPSSAHRRLTMAALRPFCCSVGQFIRDSDCTSGAGLGERRLVTMAARLFQTRRQHSCRKCVLADGQRKTYRGCFCFCFWFVFVCSMSRQTPAGEAHLYETKETGLDPGGWVDGSSHHCIRQRCLVAEGKHLMLVAP